MDLIDCSPENNESAGADPQKVAAAATKNEASNLFTMLEEAQLEHHDALVELRGIDGPQRCQFRLLRGGACLLKTSPGKA